MPGLGDVGDGGVQGPLADQLGNVISVVSG